MADRKISDLTALTTPASGDYLPIVDISEASAASKNKRITIEELMRGVPDGTAAAPGIAFETDPNTGIYRPGADQLAVSTGGTGRLFVDATGNVATGAATFPKVFTVNNINAAIALRANSSGAGFTAYSDHGLFFAVDAVNYAQIYNDGIGQLIFRTGSGLSERLRITSGGNVGIGTSSPTSLLHLADAGNITVGTTTGTKIGTATTQKIGFYNATPVVQPAAVANATDAASVIARLNDLLARLRTLGIIAT